MIRDIVEHVVGLENDEIVELLINEYDAQEEYDELMRMTRQQLYDLVVHYHGSEAAPLHSDFLVGDHNFDHEETDEEFMEHEDPFKN